MVTAHTVVLLWAASSCGWMCACALSEIDLELQLADDWINLSDKKRRERKQQARQLLLAGALIVLSLCSLSLWLVLPAALLLALTFYARISSGRKSGPKPAQTLNVAGSSVEIAGPALRAALSMLIAMGCLSVALGHIAGPWITAEVHEHLLSASRLEASDNGDPSDVHAHVATRLAAGSVQNKHLRHLMHVHDVLRAHQANGTEVRRGIGHHIKTLGHVVGASAEVAKLIGRGVQHHLSQGIQNTRKVADAGRNRRLSSGKAGSAASEPGAPAAASASGAAAGSEEAAAAEGEAEAEGDGEAEDDSAEAEAEGEGEGEAGGEGGGTEAEAGAEAGAGAAEPAAAAPTAELVDGGKPAVARDGSDGATADAERGSDAAAASASPGPEAEGGGSAANAEADAGGASADAATGDAAAASADSHEP